MMRRIFAGAGTLVLAATLSACSSTSAAKGSPAFCKDVRQIAANAAATIKIQTDQSGGPTPAQASALIDQTIADVANAARTGPTAKIRSEYAAESSVFKAMSNWTRAPNATITAGPKLSQEVQADSLAVSQDKSIAEACK